MGSFILARGSATFDDNDAEIIGFDEFYDMIRGRNSIESLHIDIRRSFRCRTYEKVMIRKSYIADQIHI